MSVCCGRERGRWCGVCRAERRLVLGVIGMVVVMTMADEVRSQSKRRLVDSPVTQTVVTVPLAQMDERATDRAVQPTIRIAVRPFNIAAYPASAFADWSVDPE